MAERCLFCDSPATRLCDAVIGLVAGDTVKLKGRPPYRVTTMEAMMSVPHTCDAPFCVAHGRVLGHYCAGKDSDTIDHCAGCVADPQSSGGVLEPDAIAAIRTQRHARYRRRRLAAVGG